MKTYDPREVSLNFANAIIDGFAEGTFVKVSRNQPSMMLRIGADGEAARARSADHSGTITFTLSQHSSSNDILSAAAQADELPGSSGVFPFFLKDQFGTTRAHAENSWVQKPADIEFGKELTEREWVLETDNLEMFLGGIAF